MNMNEPRDRHDPEELPTVKTWVKELPEDEPSMAWRASLNAKLEAIQPVAKPRPRWASWPVWSSAAGMAAIAIIAIVATRPDVNPTVAEPVAVTSDMLVDAHVESVARHDLGLATGSDLRMDRGSQPASFDWDAVDLNLL